MLRNAALVFPPGSGRSISIYDIDCRYYSKRELLG
jgi:hypothetical protein